MNYSSAYVPHGGEGVPLPPISNFGCLPGRAEGSPNGLKISAQGLEYGIH